MNIIVVVAVHVHRFDASAFDLIILFLNLKNAELRFIMISNKNIKKKNYEL